MKPCICGLQRFAVALVVVGLVAGACQSPEPTATPVSALPTDRPQAKATASQTPTAAYVPPTATPTAAPTAAPTATLLPTYTPTPEPTPTPTPAPTATPVPEPTATPTLEPNLTAHISGYDGCVVTNPPKDLLVDPFYTKYCSAGGIPVLSSEKVPDLALKIVWNTIMNMLSARPDIHSEMVRQGTLFGVLAESQVLTDMPEYQDLYTQFPGTDWNQRARGLGATGFIPLTSASEENILCYRTDRWRGYDGDNVTVHEFAHSIMNLGVVPIQPDFLANLSATYDAAVAAELWTGTFAATNIHEYWAEGVQSYFNANLDPPDPVHNHVNTREELREYDPRLFEFLTKYFPAHDWTAACPDLG